MSWELVREGHHIVVSVTRPLDAEGWESLFDAIVAEKARGGSVVVLPAEIPTTAGLGELLHETFRKNLHEHGLTLIRSA